MFKKLLPDRIFLKFDDITVDFLRENGIFALIFDIDNTLAPYEEAEPNERVKNYFNMLHEAGIKTVFVSNNHGERVELFSRTLETPFFADSKKPLTGNMKKAMTLMESTPETTAIVGDQILTDIWAGRNCKMRAFLVPPINDKKNLFFKTKRLIEKPIVRKYYKLLNEDIKNADETVIRTWG